MADRINDAGLLTVMKDIRTESIEKFKDTVRELQKDETNDGHDVLVGSAAKAVDHAIGTVLNTVFDHPSFFVDQLTLERRDAENDFEVVAHFRPGLGELYWNEVSN